MLPRVEARAQRQPRSLFPKPGRLDLLYFVITLSIDGIFTITLALLLKDLVSVESAVLSAGSCSLSRAWCRLRRRRSEVNSPTASAPSA
jgi:hypothetical protein